MFRIANVPKLQPIENMGILIHFTASMSLLVGMVGTDFELNDRVDGEIGGDMSGVTKEPCNPLLPSHPGISLERTQTRSQHVACSFIVHFVGPLFGSRVESRGDLEKIKGEIRQIGANGAQLQILEVA